MARRKKSEKQLLIERIKKQNKTVQRLYEKTLKSGEAYSFLKSQKSKFGAITKTKNRNKIALGSLSKMSIARLNLLEHQQKLFISSKYVTAKGRKEISKKQYDAMIDLGYELSQKEFNVMRELFADDDVQELRDMKNFSSDAIISIAENSAESFKNVKTAINTVMGRKDYSNLSALQVKKAIIDLL